MGELEGGDREGKGKYKRIIEGKRGKRVRNGKES